MSEPRFESFEAFWPYYVRAHSKPLTRTLHAVGTTAALGVLALALVTRRKALVPLALVVGYGPAWIGHFFVEGNKPATFGHPLWSLRADFEMLRHIARGTMADEVTRHGTAAEPSGAAASTASPDGHANAQDAHGAAAAPAGAPDRTLH